MNLKEQLESLMKDRILILDGAMGTMIQQYQLTEEDYRGERFADFPHSLKGNNDLLVLTQPQIIEEIHRSFLEAGADILETNTFNANRISMADYHMEEYVEELNVEAARIARKLTDEYSAKNPDKPRFVAGSIGPTNKTASISPDVNNPGYRAVDFDELKNVYLEQAKALLKGGAHLLLVETVFDTLNAKAAVFAILELQEEMGEEIPLMISGTITDASGRTLSGQTTEAFWISLSHAKPLSIGLNCALGADQMRPYVDALSKVAWTHVSTHPNAGLPNEFGEYDDSPEHMASVISDFAKSGYLNIVGGCCGTTPEHIRKIAEAVKEAKPRRVPQMEKEEV